MQLQITPENWSELDELVRFSNPVVNNKPRVLPFIVRQSYMKPESVMTRQLFESTEPEIMSVGPYNSGKTYPNLMRLYWMHCQVPNLQTLILRKKKVDLLRTTIPQWENKVLPFPLDDPRSPCKSYGKRSPLWYDWKNGGRTWVGNCEEAGGYLSGEYDIAFFCQAEQGTQKDWELLAQRCDGRAGNWHDDDGEPLGQLAGDCNPEVPFHWIPIRFESGMLKELKFRHEDNMLLHRDGDWTPHGKRTIERMSRSLTGVRYRRGFLGEWSAAEGAVFDEFDIDKHVIDELPHGMHRWPMYSAVDFGYDHPFTCVWVARNPETGLIVVFKEWRYTRTIVKDHAQELLKHERPRLRWADHDLEGAAQLAREGIHTLPANKEVLNGIDRMKLLLRDNLLLFYRPALIRLDPRIRERGLPRNIIEEMQGYSHKPLHKHTGVSAKDDLPIKKNDDSIDPLRYIINGVSIPRVGWHPGLIARRAYRNI